MYTAVSQSRELGANATHVLVSLVFWRTKYLNIEMFVGESSTKRLLLAIRDSRSRYSAICRNEPGARTIGAHVVTAGCVSRAQDIVVALSLLSADSPT
jgi:hypothetical protein